MAASIVSVVVMPTVGADVVITMFILSAATLGAFAIAGVSLLRDESDWDNY